MSRNELLGRCHADKSGTNDNDIIVGDIVTAHKQHHRNVSSMFTQPKAHFYWNDQSCILQRDSDLNYSRSIS